VIGLDVWVPEKSVHVSVMSGLFSETLQNATFDLVHVTWVVARGARREDREEGKRQWFEAIKPPPSW